MDQKQAVGLAAHNTVLQLKVKRWAENPELMATLHFALRAISGSPQDE
ncbi:MAG: hypothetical protein QNL87_01055 [Gammaproteobacteria bacterium]|nr:hypothetical protein [Gammaproteobacteria bacterium]